MIKIKIRMVSGKEYNLENTKCKSVAEWIESNFDIGKDFRWFGITEDSKVRLMFSNIESVEEVFD